MGQAIPLLAPASPDPCSWGFACGRTAALESGLCGRAFFDGLLRARGPSEARAALRSSPYQALFARDDDIRRSGPVLDAHFALARREMLDACPAHPLRDFAEIPPRYRSFRALFTRPGAGASASGADDLENSFRLLAHNPLYAAALAEHRAMVLRKEAPQGAGAVERSIFLDSAACTLMGLVAQATPEPLARKYMANRAVLSAWAAVMRARWNGAAPDAIRKWFVFGDSRHMATAFLAGEASPAAAAAPFCAPDIGRALAASDPARARADVDAVAADALREAVLDCRLVACGSERVLAYLVALETEAVNLQLCLAAVAGGMDRAVVAARLRREYA